MVLLTAWAGLPTRDQIVDMIVRERDPIRRSALKCLHYAAIYGASDKYMGQLLNVRGPQGIGPRSIGLIR